MNQTSPPVILHDKTSFSMMAPPILSAIQAQSAPAGNGPQQLAEVIIVGIETHICVSQTALDLRDMGYKVHVLADGVSSCNIGESKIALDRLANAGCTVRAYQLRYHANDISCQRRPGRDLAGVIVSESD